MLDLKERSAEQFPYKPERQEVHGGMAAAALAICAASGLLTGIVIGLVLGWAMWK